MGTISAQVLAHSINGSVKKDGLKYGHPEIMTMKLIFPRHILGEAKTHRIMSIEDSEVEIIIKNQIAFNDETMFSKNSASSRAIPFKRMLKTVMTDPFVPIAWQYDHSGMQGSIYHSPVQKFGFDDAVEFMYGGITKLGLTEQNEDEELHQILRNIIDKYKGQYYTLDDWWLKTRDEVVQCATLINLFNVSKQSVNRLLEPFMWHCVVVTSCEWENFFKLRCPMYTLDKEVTKDTIFHRSWKDLVNHHFHALKANRDFIDELENYSTIQKLYCNKGAAEIHMMALAEVMWDVYKANIPEMIYEGQWHVPYKDDICDFTDSYWSEYDLKLGELIQPKHKIKIATGMLAYTSYITIDKESALTYKRYAGIHDKMIEAVPFHASPFEHCNIAMSPTDWVLFGKNNPVHNKDYGWAYNMHGFIPYRYLLENPDYVKHSKP